MTDDAIVVSVCLRQTVPTDGDFTRVLNRATPPPVLAWALGFLASAVAIGSCCGHPALMILLVNVLDWILQGGITKHAMLW